MRIVELVDTLGVGGTEQMVSHLAKSLSVRGHQVSVVCLRVIGPLAHPLESAGVEVIALQKPEGFHFPTALKLARILKERSTNVVHTHNPLVHHYGVIAGRLARAGAVVNTLHGIGNLGKVGKAEVIFGISSFMTDRIVAVCRKAQDVFGKNIAVPRRKLTLIYNGIPLNSFLEIPLRTPRSKFVFGAVGRLVPVKDHATLLKAFQFVVRRYPHCRLEILGDGVLREPLLDTVRRLGLEQTATLRGASHDVAGFLAGTDAFVMCSLSEGLPLTVLEAMASGLPIISTAVGGIPELVEASQCGWLCDPGRPDRLAEAMMLAVESADLSERGARARTYAAQNCSLEEMTNQYECLFQKLLVGPVRNAENGAAR
jgi:glycosyltransferase involved in cell wall biosynthesis